MMTPSKTLVVLAVILSGAIRAAGEEPTREKPPLYFPPGQGAWESVAPAAVGWNSEKIDAAMEFARDNRSSGVVILHRGRILAERHWDVDRGGARLPDGKLNLYHFMAIGKDALGHEIEDVASAQKSFTSVLVGIAQAKGLLKIDDPVDQYLKPGWSRAPRQEEAKITVRHLLTMSSGLSNTLEYLAPAGTKWAYNTRAYAQTLRVVAAATGEEPEQFTREWLTGPIGMDNSHWVLRKDMIKKEDSQIVGNRDTQNQYGFATTARDLSRFGLLILANGVWNERVIVADRQYLRDALTPSQEMNRSYGYLWWLNPERPHGGRSNPSAPVDLVAAQGALGRKVFVVPSLELVVTRLGDAPGGGGAERKPSFDMEFWKRLMAAAPGS